MSERPSKEAIVAMLVVSHGNLSFAARKLEVAPATLRRWLDNDDTIMEAAQRRTDPSWDQADRLQRRFPITSVRQFSRYRRMRDAYTFDEERQMTDRELAAFNKVSGTPRQVG